MFTDYVKIGDLEMHIDPEKDHSLADDIFAALERAMDEGQGAAAAVLGALWVALYANYTRELAEAIRPVMARHADDSPLFFREVPS